MVCKDLYTVDELACGCRYKTENHFKLCELGMPCKHLKFLSK